MGSKNLEKAWKRVKANKGSAGIDRITIEQFEQNLQQNLAEIQRLLKEKRYEPSPVLRVLIPKDNGKVRKLGIPTAVSYTHLRAHETRHDLVCRLLLEKKKKKKEYEYYSST